MSRDIDVRDVVVGQKRSASRRALGLAAALYVLVVAYAGLAHLTGAVETAVLYLFVLAGVALAAASAYRNSGWLPGLALVAAPVAGALSFYWWLALERGARYVALPGSFEGQGAAAFWLPTVLLLGTLGFGVGTCARWATTRWSAGRE